MNFETKLKIGDLELSLAEAEKLYETLKGFFGKQEMRSNPFIPQKPFESYEPLFPATKRKTLLSPPIPAPDYFRTLIWS